MPVYLVPVTWTLHATMDIKAESVIHASIKARRLPLPTDGEYIDESFVVDDAAIRERAPEGVDAVEPQGAQT